MDRWWWYACVCVFLIDLLNGLMDGWWLDGVCVCVCGFKVRRVVGFEIKVNEKVKLRWMSGWMLAGKGEG